MVWKQKPLMWFTPSTMPPSGHVTCTSLDSQYVGVLPRPAGRRREGKGWEGKGWEGRSELGRQGLGRQERAGKARAGKVSFLAKGFLYILVLIIRRNREVPGTWGEWGVRVGREGGAHPHALPSRPTLTPHSHAPPSRPTLTPHPHAPPPTPPSRPE